MGSEGQQDIEMAILTALLKGKLSGNDLPGALLIAGTSLLLCSCQELCLLGMEPRASQGA